MRLSVVRKESLGTRNSPSSGESKSSMRKTAEATQIAGGVAVGNGFKRSARRDDHLPWPPPCQ
jgi:hypothetical protein